MPRAQPNILIVMVDQLAAGALPIYGFGTTKAPHLETLAREGVIFDRAYCNSPLCSPSRAAFMSGRLPSKTGVYDNAAEFHSDIPTFAHHLRAMGYRTVLSGKMHFCGPDQLHGFEERLTTDIYPADFGWTPDWDRPGDRPSWYHNTSSVTDAGVCVRTNQLDFDEAVAFAAEQALYDHARSRDGRPLCLVASFTHPHDPFAITQEFWDLYSNEPIPAPRIAVSRQALDPHSRRLRQIAAMDDAEISEAQIRAARRAYFGAISYVDAKLGRLLHTLSATGLREDTVVVFTADHGEMLGERGLWYKMSWFEAAARVPLIISAPSRFAPQRVHESVSLVDILPTLVDLAGGAPEEVLGDVDGRSLLPHCQGHGGHDGAVGEYCAEGALAPLVMIRRGPWKFVHSSADPDQLYDLDADPDERLNRADDSQYDEVRESFRAECRSRWDLAGLDSAVRLSQRRRRLVNRALTVGRVTPWDFQPLRDASRQYMRNIIELDELEANARFPRLRP